MAPKLIKLLFILLFAWAFYSYNPLLGIIGVLVAFAISKLLTNVFLFRVIRNISQFHFTAGYKLAQFTSGWENSKVSQELESFCKALVELESDPDQTRSLLQSYFESTVPIIVDLAVMTYGTFFGFPQALQWFHQKFPIIDNNLPGIYRPSYLLTLANCGETEKLIDDFMLLSNPLTYFNKNGPCANDWGLLTVFACAGEIEATEAFANLISLRKDHEARLYWTAIAYSNHGEIEKAKQLFEAALKGKSKKIKWWVKNQLVTLSSHESITLSEQHQQLLTDFKKANAITASSIKDVQQISQVLKIFMWSVLIIIVLFTLPMLIIPFILWLESFR